MTRRIPGYMRKSPQEKQVAREQKRLNKLASIKHQLGSGHITCFEQMFIIMSEYGLAKELHISRYIFHKRIYDPTEFTLAELMRFSALLNVPFNDICNFILQCPNVIKKPLAHPVHMVEQQLGTNAQL